MKPDESTAEGRQGHRLPGRDPQIPMPDVPPPATTKEQDDRAEWLDMRRTGVGGSDVAAVMGVDDFGRTPATLWDEKTGAVVPPDIGDLPHIQRGRHLEAIASDMFVTQTGIKLRRQPMRRHKQYPWMVANVDRQAVNTGRTTPGVVEIKCPGLARFGALKAHGLSDAYILQGQHYLEVYDYDWGRFALFSAERWQLLEFEFERDRTVGAYIVERTREFWDAVETGVRPTEDAVESIDLPEVGGEVRVIDTPEWTDAVAMLRDAHDLMCTATELRDAARSRCQDVMGGHGVVEGAGIRAYWRPSKPGTTFDHRALASARPVDRVALAATLCAEHGMDIAAVEKIVKGALLDLDAFRRPRKQSVPFRFYTVPPTGPQEVV